MDAIADTTVLTNFALIKGEEVLRKVFKGSLFTTAEVLKELWQGEEKRLFPKRDWKWLKALKVESEDERQAFKLMAHLERVWVKMSYKLLIIYRKIREKEVLDKKKSCMMTALGKRIVSMSFLHVFSRNPVLYIVDSRSKTLRE